jgi:hypothetical protein
MRPAAPRKPPAATTVRRAERRSRGTRHAGVENSRARRWNRRAAAARRPPRFISTSEVRSCCRPERPTAQWMPSTTSLLRESSQVCRSARYIAGSSQHLLGREIPQGRVSLRLHGPVRTIGGRRLHAAVVPGFPDALPSRRRGAGARTRLRRRRWPLPRNRQIRHQSSLSLTLAHPTGHDTAAATNQRTLAARSVPVRD